jgi:hypothetical protein
MNLAPYPCNKSGFDVVIEEAVWLCTCMYLWGFAQTIGPKAKTYRPKVQWPLVCFQSRLLPKPVIVPWLAGGAAHSP